MKKRLKGSITVFLLVITTVFITLITTFIDVVRVDSAFNVVTRASYLVSDSKVFIDEKLMLEYGFLLFEESVTEETLSDYFNKMLTANLDSKVKTDIRCSNTVVEFFSLGESVDGKFNNDIIILLVDKIAKTEIPYEEYTRLYETLDKMYKPSARLESCYIKLPQGYSDKNTFYSRINSLCFDKMTFNSPSKEYQDIYNNRFSLECDDNWNQTEWDFQNSYSAIPKNRGDENSKALSMAYDHISNNIWFERTDGSVSWNSGFSYDMNNIVLYLDRHFGTFLENENQPLNAQLEYIQFGKKSDIENVMCMLEKIYNYRYAMNLMSLVNDSKLSNSQKIQKAEKEAELDVILLTQGKSIPLVKESKKFLSSPKMTDKELKDKAFNTESYVEKDAVSYKDYVLFGIFHSTNFEMLYSRLVDLMSFSTGSNLKERKIMATVTADIEVDYSPTSVMGLLNLINNKGKIEAVT